jgi:serine/threonine protein kinase/tetratricopeptide (TPR) repeat protein
LTGERLKRVEAIFFRVVGLEAPERARVLDAECAGDAPLRAEIESLVSHSAVPDDFLATPALARAALTQAASDPAGESDAMVGRTVGAYRIQERIASGGMGTVYLGARADGAFKQQVAIKVVKRGMDTDEIARRFRTERQTLANMAHPNIAGLLDGGATEDGRPYLVMEFVHGTPIDRYCEERRLDTVQRLRLFLQVCRAVQSAHQNLVIHRDLKPGNILVTPEGVPKLLDFGVAKVLLGPEAGGTSAGEPTIPEQRRLTPEYASPEQIQGLPVTTASDVYSLGVILYELLSGQRPYHFRTRTTGEIERVVCHVDPPLPSAVVGRAPDSQAACSAKAGRPPAPSVGAAQKTRRRLRGDLDTIVLMALRKEPSRRYTSVEQLSGDIERYLRGLPVMARKDTFAYRASKFVRRHALGTAAAAGIALAVLAGAVGIAWQARNTARERDAAFMARDQSEQIAKFLRDTLVSVDPGEKGPEATVRQVLDDAAARVDVELVNEPLVHAAVLSAIGTSYLGLGMLDKAQACITRAMNERRSLLGEGHHDMAESMLDLASVFYARERFDEAEPLLRRALQIFRTIRGDHNLDIARTSNDLGAVLRALGRLDEAESFHRQALEIRRAHDGPESLTVAESLNNLAGVLKARGDRAGADQALTEALRIRRKLLPPDHARVAQSIGNLAVFYAGNAEYARAKPLLREAVALEEKSIGPDHPDHAVTLTNLGSLLMLEGGADAEAEGLLRRALAIRREKLPPGDSRTAYTQALLGRSLLRQKRYEEAESALTGALTDLRQAGPRAESRVAAVLDDLALLYEATGRPEKAAEARASRPAPRP